MSYRLVPYTAEWEAAVARANSRLLNSGKAPFLLPDHAPPPAPEGCFRRDHWLAVGADDEVRGGFLQQTMPAWVSNESTEVVNVQSPLSEGLIDHRHIGLGPWMVRELVRRHPFAYSVGMGGEEMPYPRLLKALGWRVEPVPFYFRILAGRLFLANVRPLRQHPKLGVLAKIGGVVPVLPDAVFALLHAWRSVESPRAHTGKTSDWISIRARYGFAIDRSPEMLAALYPPSDAHFLRLSVPGGVCILRGSQFHGHAYFGDLFVAIMVEAICEPGAERPLLLAALDGARAMGAALLLTNQTAPELCSALKSAGWLSYRSNFLVGLSPTLTKRVADRPVYVNRGDGDGLLNL